MTTTTLTLDPLPRRVFRLRPSRPQPVVESSVTTVTRNDGLWNGVLIGFAVGSISTAIAGCAQDDGTGGGECMVAVLGAPLIGNVGAIIGAVIDAKRNKIVYRAAAPRVAGRATLALTPVLGANIKGVLLRVQF